MNKDNIFTSITTISLIVALFATASIMQQQANGQIIKDGISEDQVIICVNGHVVELAGNICKVFQVDDQSLTEAQEDLYKNPDNDTFDMEVLD